MCDFILRDLIQMLIFTKKLVADGGVAFPNQGRLTEPVEPADGYGRVIEWILILLQSLT